MNIQRGDWLIALANVSLSLIFGGGTHALFTFIKSSLRMIKRAVPKHITTDYETKIMMPSSIGWV